MFHLGCPLPPHPQLPSPHRPPRVIPCSPEEIEVDGGELVLDEGPERPEKVRSLQTEQRVARRPAKPGPDPVYGGGGVEGDSLSGKHRTRTLAGTRWGLPSTGGEVTG